MMTLSRTFSRLAAVVALGALAACTGSNGVEQQRAGLGDITSILLNRSTATAAPSVESALARTELPVNQLRLTGRDVTAFVIRIEQNGPYLTYASGDQRTVIYKNGMIVGTRGLGEDLMSSTADRSLALVRGRKNGTVQRIQRYLTPDNRTVELVATCEIAYGGEEAYSAGLVKTPVTRMTESCVAEGLAIENAYLVDRRGEIVFARQYLSPGNGYVMSYSLRR